jgi:tRNA(Ile)-lysidine synthase
LRPLLDERRAALRDYAVAGSLAWNEDSSNEDISLARNRLRRRLLGDLQQINPAAVDNVARAAALMREEEEWLDDLAVGAMQELRREDDFPGARTLCEEGLAALPRPLRRRVVRRAIEEVRGHCRGISGDHVEWIVGGCETSLRARDLPGVRVTRDGARVRFMPLQGRRLARPRTG